MVSVASVSSVMVGIMMSMMIIWVWDIFLLNSAFNLRWNCNLFITFNWNSVDSMNWDFSRCEEMVINIDSLWDCSLNSVWYS